jgi:23S rRNA pseudouridine1911/1915/1917 synthase
MNDHQSQLDVLYCDNPVLVVRKPAGVPVQPDSSGDETLIDIGKRYIAVRVEKPGAVYLASVHRLDRPVSGVVIFGRTSKAAARLSEQFQTSSIKKTYWAIVAGIARPRGRLQHRLLRHGPTSSVTAKMQGKLAVLEYRRVKLFDGRSALVVHPETGRHHQIRVQLAAIRHIIIGDMRYGSKLSFPHRAIALHARSIEFEHPTTKETMTFTCDPADYWPNVFDEAGG